MERGTVAVAHYPCDVTKQLILREELYIREWVTEKLERPSLSRQDLFFRIFFSLGYQYSKYHMYTFL